jgi:hypothetical protein
VIELWGAQSANEESVYKLAEDILHRRGRSGIGNVCFFSVESAIVRWENIKELAEGFSIGDGCCGEQDVSLFILPAEVY